MFTFLLVLQAIIAAALVTVILMQKSEGGGLTAGSPTGLMSARGAANFLTRATAMLAGAFVVCCIALATLASLNNRTTKVDASAAPASQTAPSATPEPAAPVDPLAAAAGQAAGNSSNGTVPATR